MKDLEQALQVSDPEGSEFPERLSPHITSNNTNTCWHVITLGINCYDLNTNYETVYSIQSLLSGTCRSSELIRAFLCAYFANSTQTMVTLSQKETEQLRLTGRAFLPSLLAVGGFYVWRLTTKPLGHAEKIGEFVFSQSAAIGLGLCRKIHINGVQFIRRVSIGIHRYPIQGAPGWTILHLSEGLRPGEVDRGRSEELGGANWRSVFSCTSATGSI